MDGVLSFSARPIKMVLVLRVVMLMITGRYGAHTAYKMMNGGAYGIP